MYFLLLSVSRDYKIFIKLYKQRLGWGAIDCLDHFWAIPMFLNRKSSSPLSQRQVSQHQDATSPHFKDTCWELESAIDCIKAWTTEHISPNKSCSWWVNTLYSWHLNSPYLPLIWTYTILQVKSVSLIKIDVNEKLDHVIWSESNQLLKDKHYDRIYIKTLYFIEHCECLNICTVNIYRQ